MFSHPHIESQIGKRIRPDPSMYHENVQTKPKVTQFDKLELNFELKQHSSEDPFCDPDKGQDLHSSMADAELLTGWATCTYPAWDIGKKKLCFLKHS
jgi:hypothetical protein